MSDGTILDGHEELELVAIKDTVTRFDAILLAVTDER
jgi:hypothetical protein